MGIDIKEIIFDKRFIYGLAAKFLLVAIVVPDIQKDLFIPFYSFFFDNPSLDPWTNFYIEGNNPESFPYGPIMFLYQLPLTFLGHSLDILLNENFLNAVGFKLGILFADLLILFTLLREYPDKKNTLLVFFWLSPILIYINYWHGQLDIIPVAFLTLSLIYLRNKNLSKTAFYLAISIAIKHSMAIILPFLLIYIWFKRSIGFDFKKFVFVLIFSLFLLEFALFFSEGFEKMVLMSPEILRIFWLKISLTQSVEIFFTPVLFLILLYNFWRIKSIDYELLLAYVILSFSVIILFTAPSPGWFAWISPILAIHLHYRKAGSYIIFYLLSFVFIFYHLNVSQSAQISFMNISNNFIFLEDLISAIDPFLYSIIFVLFAILIFQIYRDGVRGNEFYILGKSPIKLAISGTTCDFSNKFTFFVQRLFGPQQVFKLNQSDYLNFNVKSPIKDKLSNFDPRSFAITKMLADIRRLANNESIALKKNMKDSFNSNYQVIINENPFALYSEKLSSIMDIKFFIDNHKCLSTNKELFDYEKFIKPQRINADIITIFDKAPLIEKNKSDYVNLTFLIRDELLYIDINRTLVGVCGLSVEFNKSSELSSFYSLIIQGEFTVSDLQLALNILMPKIREFIDEDFLHGGNFGLLQLFFLYEVYQTIKEKKKL